jgi:hypothetical protein
MAQSSVRGACGFVLTFNPDIDRTGPISPESLAFLRKAKQHLWAGSIPPVNEPNGQAGVLAGQRRLK